MNVDELIKRDNMPTWFVPENWHMLITSPSALPVLVKGPATHEIDEDYAVMQFTFVNVGSFDMDIAQVSTFYWDPVKKESCLRIDLNSPYTLASKATFTCDRMVSRHEFESVL